MKKMNIGMAGSVLLFAAALFAGGTAWVSFRGPTEFAAYLGYVVPGHDGRNEVRAQYGGFFLAVSIVNLLALTNRLPRKAGFLVNSTVFGGLLTGRLISLLVDSGPAGYGPVIGSLFFVDGIGFLSSLALLLSAKAQGTTTEANIHVSAAPGSRAADCRAPAGIHDPTGQRGDGAISSS